MRFNAGSAKPEELMDVFTIYTNKFVQVWRPNGQNVQEGDPHLCDDANARVYFWTLHSGTQDQ
jgi:hypothetical protein